MTADGCVSCGMARGKVAEFARLASSRQRKSQNYEGYVARIEALKREMRACAAIGHATVAASSRAGGEAKKRTVAT